MSFAMASHDASQLSVKESRPKLYLNSTILLSSSFQKSAFISKCSANCAKNLTSPSLATPSAVRLTYNFLSSEERMFSGRVSPSRYQYFLTNFSHTEWTVPMRALSSSAAKTGCFSAMRTARAFRRKSAAADFVKVVRMMRDGLTGSSFRVSISAKSWVNR